MNAGISQKVELLGKAFSVETELDGPKLRAEVFLGGKLMAARESQLNPPERDLSPERLRAKLLQYHQEVVSGIAGRVERYSHHKQAAVAAETVSQRPASGSISETVVKARVPSRNGKPSCSSQQSQLNGDLQVIAGPRPGILSKRTAAPSTEAIMAKVNLASLNQIDGFLGACMVDSDSGMMLGAEGGGPVNLELAAAGNTQVVRAKRKTMDTLKINDRIEDILISLENQYHIIRPLESNKNLFLYVVLDRARSNLAMARHELKAFETGLSLN